MNPPCSSEKGLILLLVLWIMIVLTLLATAFYQLTNLEIQTSRNDMDKLQARLLAEGALEFSRAVLAAENDGVSDGMKGLWSGAGTLFQETTLGEGMFQIYSADLDAPEGGTRFGLVDESSKLNLNTATLEMLQKLPGMTNEMAAAVVDWRDADSEETPGGAESEFYNNLTPSYDCANREFDRVAELLKVKGFTPMVLYGEDVNRDGTLQRAEDDGDENDPPDDGDGKLNHGLAPYLTVYSYDRNVNSLGEKRLNIKTASDEQIRTRLEGKLKPQVVDAILEAKKQGEINNLTDLWKEPGSAPSSDSGQAAPTPTPTPTPAPAGDVESASETAAALSIEDFKVIADELTVSDEEHLRGLVNINTASRAVLMALPGMTEEVAETIVNRKTSEVGGFTSVTELASLEGMSRDAFSQMFPHVTVRANVFEAQSVGYVPKRKAYAAVYAIIDRGGMGPVYRYHRIQR